MRNILIFYQPVLDCVLKNLDYPNFTTLSEIINLEEDYYQKEEIQSFLRYYNQVSTNNSLRIIFRFLERVPDSIRVLHNLKDLTIENTGLTELPNSIGGLTNLKVLNLSKNNLIELPDSIGNLIKLKKLNVSCNKIKKLPCTLCNLIKLKCLWLFENELTELPDTIGNLNKLLVLNVRNNKLSELPISIQYLTVTDIYLENNEIKILPDWFDNLVNLNYCSLDDNVVIPPNLELLDTITIANQRALINRNNLIFD